MGVQCESEDVSRFCSLGCPGGAFGGVNWVSSFSSVEERAWIRQRLSPLLALRLREFRAQRPLEQQPLSDL